jgi:pimeloyl-ACP methyl ester carboxylesterase
MRLTFDVWRRLIEIDPALFMRYALVDGYTAAGLTAIEPMHQMVIDIASAAVQPGSDAHLELDLRINIDDSLSSITAPCLVIGGIEDRWVDISHSRYLASRIAHATLLELPAGHLVIGEMAEAIAGAMSHHVNSLN